MGDPQTGANAGTIYDRFRSRVHGFLSLVGQYDNGPFITSDEQEVDQPKPGQEDVWFRVSIDYNDSFHAEMGGAGRHRTVAFLIVEIMTDLNVGTSEVDNLHDLILSAFRSTNADGIMYHTPTRNRGGRTEDGAWWRTTISIPFHYDD